MLIRDAEYLHLFNKSLEVRIAKLASTFDDKLKTLQNIKRFVLILYEDNDVGVHMLVVVRFHSKRSFIINLHIIMHNC